MAKGQKRGNREAKKPKANKKKVSAPAGVIVGKPKTGSGTTDTKK